MFRSLRVRLAITNAAALIVILYVLGGTGLAFLSSSLDRHATEEVEQMVRIERLRLALTDEESFTSEGARTYVHSHENPTAATILVGVFDMEGQVLATPDPLPSWLRPYPERIRDVVVVNGDETRFITERAELGDGTPVLIVAARSLERLHQTLDAVRQMLGVGAVLAVALSAFAGWWLSGRSMKPIAASYDAQRTFASDASHELRTPLTFIRAGVEVLAPSNIDLGRQVLDEIDYMAALTDRMLLLARAERRDIALERQPFDLGDICRSAADRSRVAHGSKLDVDGPDIQALGDPVVTEMILDVLLENVARYAGGAASIRWSGNGDGIDVVVADRGRGLPEDSHERVFDRFTRIESSRDRDAGGAGLGLPIARSLAMAQGGNLRLSTTEGGGLTATLELPSGG